MTLKQLEYFLEIAKMGSVSKAAESLNISQPPLSLQLKSLEEELGTTLFIRSKQGLKITPEGVLLQNRAGTILDLVSEAKTDIQEKTGKQESLVRVGTIGSVNNRLLPQIIAKYNLSYPYVRFQVYEGSTEHILAELSEGSVDFGFVRRPFNISNFASKPIRDPLLAPGESDYFAIVGLPKFIDESMIDPETKSVPVEALQGRPLVIHQRYHKMIVSICQKHGFTPDIICENGEITSSLSWARAGIGLAVAPYTSTAINEDERLQTYRIKNVPMNPEVCIVWNPDNHLSGEVRAFIKAL